VQIVGYDTGVDAEPALLVGDDGDLWREALSKRRDLAYTLGERHCAGTIDGETHLSCPRESAPYCDQHTDRWPCARCTGECALPLESCREEHAVYLAGFAPATFKVGVTRSWRLDTRLREQGADVAAHLRTVKNGRVARRIEAEIAADIGDRVRVPTKIDGLHLSVDEAAWQALLSEFAPIETYQFDHGLELADRPMAETLLTGAVWGTQGRVLVVENGAGTYAVDMRDLVGYEVTAKGTDRQLQSSLGAFGDS